MNTLRATLAAMLAGALIGLPTAHAQTLFQEDFESYAAGSNLVGQGGWTGSLLPMFVNDSPLFGDVSSRVLDGLLAGQPGNGFGSALHSFTAPTERYVLSFDAVVGTPRSTWGGLSSLSEGTATRIDTGIFWAVSPLWSLNIRDAGNPVVTFQPASLGGSPVHLSITVDPVTRQVFGSYDAGVGWIDTPSFTVSQHLIDVLDGVNFGVDYRGSNNVYPGMQVDNIRIAAAVPEGGTRELLLAGVAALAACLRRWRGAPEMMEAT